MKICIDPGHGGNDTGAGGPSGLEEATVALDISLRLRDLLVNYGFEIEMTREIDEFIELGDRCDIANEFEADYFVSVHLNSNGSTAIGIETLYKSSAGKTLAGPVHDSMIDATGDVDRGLKKRDDLYVLNGTDMPAILVEVGFISHPETEKKFKTDAYRKLLAESIAIALAEFRTPPPLA